MNSEPVQAILLGILQGITEFLPVSSSGHLALAQILFGLEEGGLVLSVMLHAGTLFATIIMLRRQIAPAVTDGFRGLLKPSLFQETSGGRDALTIILASVPTALIGLSLRNAVESWTHSPLAVSIGFLATSGLLLSTRWIKPGAVSSPTLWGALLIGAAQGLAVLPGVSRSGSTIAVALWLGVRPDRAFELSMLMSLPAVAGAVVATVPSANSAPGQWPIAIVGAAVALAVGLAALAILRRLVVRGHFAWFTLWVLPLAIATLALARAWPS